MGSRRLFLFSLLAFPLLTGCADKVPLPGLPPAVTAISQDGAIYILDTQKALLKQAVSSGFFQARLSPDKTKVACIHEGDFFISIFDLGSDGDFVNKPKTVYNTQALSTEGSQGKAYYPTWSADGNKFYFLNTNHLVLYDYQEKRTTVLFDFPDSQSGGTDPESGDMALSRDGNSLYLRLGQGDKVAFWRVDVSGAFESQLALGDKSAVSQFHFPAELSDECLETLFGSKEDPVLDPAVSGDGKYYFYVEKGTGFLAKNLLKGYDRKKKVAFDVATLGTALFR